MARILIVYGTTDGHTEKIAMFSATALRAEGYDVDVSEASTAPSADGYDAVFVAASLHAGGYQHSVETWIRGTLPRLRERPNAFVSVCLGVLQRDAAVDADLASIRQRFLSATGWQPDDTAIVAGALPYTHYNWLKRYAMKRIVKKAGGDTDTSRDFEYTDWDALRTFVLTFVRTSAERRGQTVARR